MYNHTHINLYSECRENRVFWGVLGGLWENYWSDQSQTCHLARGQRSIDDIITTFDSGENKYALLIFQKKYFCMSIPWKLQGKPCVLLKFKKNGLPLIKNGRNWYHKKRIIIFFHPSTTFKLYGHLAAQKSKNKVACFF